MPKEIHFHACVFYAIAASDRLPINRNTGKVVVSYLFPFHSYKFLFIIHFQGQPSGFDIMSLALTGSNKHVRFGLKVFWES